MKRLILSVLLLSFLVFSVPVQAVNYTRTSERSTVESFLEEIINPIIPILCIGASLASWYLCFQLIKLTRNS
jgi:hypothetical protein